MWNKPCWQFSCPNQPNEHLPSVQRPSSDRHQSSPFKQWHIFLQPSPKVPFGHGTKPRNEHTEAEQCEYEIMNFPLQVFDYREWLHAKLLCTQHIQSHCIFSSGFSLIPRIHTDQTTDHLVYCMSSKVKKLNSFTFFHFLHIFYFSGFDVISILYSCHANQGQMVICPIYI